MEKAGGTAPAYASLAGASMGTTWSVKLYDPGVDLGRLQKAIQAALDEIIAQMSTWDPDSAICRLNRAEAGWYQLAPAFFGVLRQALDLAAASDGAYDPTVGALVDLWGFGSSGPVDMPPASDAIQSALSKSGWQRTALNTEHRGVWQPGGLQFDLSSIAKGYGVDEIARVLATAGVANYLAELGGELKAAGAGPSGSAWKLDIESPVGEGECIPVVLQDAAIATSGDYRRHFIYQDRRYAHTLDPRSGVPLRNTLASVSVIHPQCMMADGLATTLLALGLQQGLEHARRHRIAALFIIRHDADFAVEWTDEFAHLAGATPLHHAS